MFSLKQSIVRPKVSLWGAWVKLKSCFRINYGSTNINIFILLSSLTAPGRLNHAYSINRRHAQCSKVSVSIHKHPQIPWQKLFVFTRACKTRKKKEIDTKKDGERNVRKAQELTLKKMPLFAFTGCCLKWWHVAHIWPMCHPFTYFLGKEECFPFLHCVWYGFDSKCK